MQIVLQMNMYSLEIFNSNAVSWHDIPSILGAPLAPSSYILQTSMLSLYQLYLLDDSLLEMLFLLWQNTLLWAWDKIRPYIGVL